MRSKHHDFDIESEKNIRNEMNALNLWNAQYGSGLNDYIRIIDDFLHDHSDYALRQLSNLFDDKEFLLHYKSKPIIAFMIIIIKIYNDESINPDLTNTILDNGHSIDELIYHFRDVKFLLWNVEFDTERTNALATIDQYINNKSISIIELSHIIQSTSINVSEMFLTISQYFRNNNNITAAIMLLTKAVIKSPHNEKILCEIADINFEYGYKEVALKFVTMMESQSEYSIFLKNKWGLL